MTMPFAALARARARMREGGMEGEQESYRRAQIQRAQEAQESEAAFRRWALEKQLSDAADDRAYRRSRDTLADTRYADEQKRQAESAQVDAVRQGFEAAPESQTSALLAGMSMMQGGTGAASGMVKAPQTKRFETTVAGVPIRAAETGGPQYVIVGGRVMKLDRQQQANAAAEAQAQQAAMQEAQANRADARAEARDARMMARQLAAINARQSDPNANLRTVPMGAMQAYQGNLQQMRTIDDAIAAVQANPDAVGFKAKLPGDILNRLDRPGYKDGTTARANIADIGSMVIHDRSGAAVTVSEFPRLRPFIPLPDDPSDVVLKKLDRMRQILQNETQFMADAYGPDAGYRPLPSAPAPRGQSPALDVGAHLNAIADRFEKRGGAR